MGLDYNELAALFTSLTAEGATVAEAIKRVVGAHFVGRKKLTVAQREEIRQRRMQGEYLAEIAADYGINERTAGGICRGIQRPKRQQTPLPQVVAKVKVEIADVFGLPLDGPVWAVRGRPSKRMTTIRKAGALALREGAQLSFPTIARALGLKDHTSVIYLVDSGRRDPVAARAAREIVGRLKPAAKEAA